MNTNDAGFGEQSGSIVDGLSFFLKNVTSHFEGIAECAICYSCVSFACAMTDGNAADVSMPSLCLHSVVNATDGSLPRKPCKTCKNRFHAACLYKVRNLTCGVSHVTHGLSQWFNTSHSSSCPLCRSEIMTGR